MDYSQKSKEKRCLSSENEWIRKWYKGLSIFFGLVLLVLLIIIIKAFMDGEFKSIESLQRYIAKYGTLGPIMLTIIQALQVILPILPGFLGCAVGAILYGPLIGFLCNYIGCSAGSVAAFYLARKYGEPVVKTLFPSEKYQKYARKASESKSYARFLFVAMLLPLFPDDYLCYLTGLTQMNGKKYIKIIVFGKPWCILAYSIFFAMV